jgi:hypothetical protein
MRKRQTGFRPSHQHAGAVIWALPGLSGLPALRTDQAPTNEFLAFGKTVENNLVVMMVTLIVAGPLFGMLALQIRELKEVVIEKEEVFARHMTNTVVVLVAIIPAVMF